MATPESPAIKPRLRLLSRPWVAVLLLVLINLFNYIDRYILAAVEGPIRDELFPKGSVGEQSAATRMGFLATAFLLAYMTLSPIFGALADRWKRWWIIGVGVLLWSLASAGSGLATSFGFLLLMRILIGVGEAAYAPVAPTIIADLYPVERRGAVLAWFYTALPVGSALGYVLGGAIASMSSWHWAFFVTLPPGILLAALCFMMKETPRGMSESRETKPLQEHRRIRGRDLRALFSIPSYVINTAGMTAMTFAIGGISFWAPTYITEHRLALPMTTPDELERLRASVNMTFGGIVVVSGLLATLTGGWLADRLRPRYSGSYFLVSGIAMLAGFPLFLGVIYAPFPAAWAFVFFAVFCLFFNTGPSNAITANVAPPAIRASAFAINIFIIHILGDVISPPLIGWITDATMTPEMPKGNMSLAFMVVGLAIVLGGVFWLIGIKHLGRDTLLAPSRLDSEDEHGRRP